MNALAIDFGSTACKASVIAINGNVLGSGLERVPTTFGEGGLGEQDPEVIWNSTLSACRQALVAAGNASYGDPERTSIANELQSLRDQLFAVANRTDGSGLPLFGGQGLERQAFCRFFVELLRHRRRTG